MNTEPGARLLAHRLQRLAVMLIENPSAAARIAGIKPMEPSPR